MYCNIYGLSRSYHFDVSVSRIFKSSSEVSLNHTTPDFNCRGAVKRVSYLCLKWFCETHILHTLLLRNIYHHRLFKFVSLDGKEKRKMALREKSRILEACLEKYFLSYILLKYLFINLQSQKKGNEKSRHNKSWLQTELVWCTIRKLSAIILLKIASYNYCSLGSHRERGR